MAPFGYEYEFEGIKESPSHYDYRNKMEFSFGDEVKDGPLALGMHKRGSFYDIVTVDGCRIADEDFRAVLKETLAYFTEKEIPSSAGKKSREDRRNTSVPGDDFPDGARSE